MARSHSRLKWRKWAGVRARVLTRDRRTCRKCGRIGGRLEVDHIRPLYLLKPGEAYDMGNLQTLCRRCHFAKTAAEFGRVIPAAARKQIEAWGERQEKIASKA